MVISAVTNVIENLLSSLNIQPTSYGFMFPPEIDQIKVAEMVSNKVFPTITGLAPALTYAILLSLARYVLHIILFKPLAERSMKIKEVPFQKIKEIDRAISPKSKSIDQLKVREFCASSGRSEVEVNKYLWTRKRATIVHRKIVKYVEAFWRAMFYISFSILGYYALFVPETASWILDTKQHFIDWPLHPMSSAISFYYQIELGCYIHQLLWTEVTRSDAMEMILHHLITILLIVFSYLTNFTRIGASILFLHDLSDIFLETAKVFNYTSKAKGHTWTKSIVDVLFGIFAVTFLVTRLVLFPRYILYSVIVEGVNHFGCEFCGCYVFIGLLCTLQCLHIFWFYLISKMLYRIATTGIEKDERSDDEELDDNDNDDDDDDTKGKSNGVGSPQLSKGVKKVN